MPSRRRASTLRHMQGLLAASALAQGCNQPKYDDIMIPPEPPRDVQPASDPVVEPTRIPVNDIHVETAWLNARQLVVHVLTPEGTFTAQPAMSADGKGVELTTGAVPHLRPIADEPAPPPGSVTPTAGTVHAVGEDASPGARDHWFLFRDLAGVKVLYLVAPTTSGGELVVAFTLPPELGGHVDVRVEAR